MVLMKLFFVRLLCCMAGVFLFINPAYAAQVDEIQWKVPFLGVMKGIDGFTVVEMEQWLQELEPTLSAAQGKKDGKMSSVDIPKLGKLQLPEEIKMYQLQVDSGNAYHLAWAIVFKDKENEKNKTKMESYFTTEQEQEQNQFLNEMNGILFQGIQVLEKESAKTGLVKVEVLNLMPLDKLNGSSEVIYGVGGRMIVNIKGLVIPFYAKAFFLNRENRLVSAIVLTQDVDGEFWRDVTDQLFLSLTK